jgi:DNA-binding MurR/RpiR family transcriptional regulator
MIEQKLLRDVIKEKYSTLSEGQKIVAQYIMDYPEESAFKTATQIGMEVGVSESTVIRLSYSLGLDGFTHLQQVIRVQYVKTNSTVYKFQESTLSNEKKNNLFANVLERDIEILTKMNREQKDVDIWAAVSAISEADHVFVVGYRYSYGPASWFSFMLNIMLGNVSLYPSSNDMVEKMTHLTENSVVVVISFPRYTKETVRFTEMAKQKGAKVIAITDKLLSPVGRIADITLTTDINTLSGMDSIASISSLLNLVITGVSNKQQKNIKKKLKILEQEYKQHGIFVDY